MAKHPSIQNLDRTFGWVSLCVLIYALATSWYAWTDERANYLSTLTTVTALEAKALDNYLSHLESDLKELGEDLTQNGDRIDLATAYTLVKKFKEVHSELFNVTLISPTGQVLLTAKNPPGTSTGTLAKEPSFIAFIDEMQQGKASSIGQPLVSVINKVVIVPVRHALKDRQGNLIYIVSANLPHEHLRSFWEDAPITSQAAIGLMRDNGYLLSRYPVPVGLSLEQIYGRPRSGALINHLQKEAFPEQGHVQGPTSLDGTDFMSVFRRLPHHPATLFVAMPMAEVRAGWFERVSTTYIAIVVLSLGWFAAYRYARRRQLAWNADQSRLEEARQESAAELLASETRFRTLFAHNNAIILQIDPVTGQILDANAAASQFYGWSLNELRSKSIRNCPRTPILRG
jgi:PAS domain-containing protein